MFELEQKRIEDQIRAYCADSGLPEPKLQWSSIPFSGHWGISTSFFQLAAQEAREKGLKGNVGERAQAIASGAAAVLGSPEGFERLEAVRGYLNLYFSTAEYTRRVLDTVLTQGDAFGCGKPKGEQVMVEFSQPNTHKAFHVGHLRSAILGDVLGHILEAAGYDVVRANYPGDIGLHVIKWMWNYMKFHMGEKPQQDITRWMGDLYSEASKRLEANPDLEAEVREVYSRWDKQDPDLVALWKETRQWSLDGFKEMYELLGIHFDVYYFQSMVEESGKQMVADLIARGIAKDERPDGAVIVKLDELLGLTKEKYRVMVVLRSDGTALYATEDLALAARKFADYPNLARSLYVVDVRQSLHFQQVFKTLELAGFPWATRCQHIPYELVTLPGNVAMASREGTVVLLEDLVREATARALSIVQTKNPELSAEKQLEIAQAVALGAIRYSMISRENTKVVTFDWEAVLNFDGQAAPYIQYAYVRAGSILRKWGKEMPPSALPAYELSPAEVQLVEVISRLPGEIQTAANDYRPMTLSNLAYDLAKAFNDFYNQCPVLQAEPAVRDGRLRLVAAARQAIGNALNVLGVIAPQAM
ncbi:arginyl-tRNA synthetase [Longilinea arvoryzae]|uniref:Arginine--tRNA ligase n=1 Tax=Longilinea arvoryzae TaxID=360412 RepID=A0A0S7BKB0_9CHLR|nr:arginine--tRNA ligase [Longilinea arvoryzae]GAP14245.1 arginyl-tRNA synthetase [Longilinea arvoryzae]